MLKIDRESRVIPLFNNAEKSIKISNKKKILYLKHPSWAGPEGKDAIARIIYHHIDKLIPNGYEIDLLEYERLTPEIANNYDYVHCSFWFQCYKCIRIGVPYILTMHDSYPLLEHKDELLYHVYETSIKNSLVTIGQTDQTKEQWARYSDKILSIPVAVDTDLLKSNGAEREDFVLSVGTITTIKGHSLVAKACNELGVKCVVIGSDEGDETEVSLLNIEIEKSNGNIKWIKEIPHVELIDYYSKCRVFCLATEMDVPGLVVLEALSCGANVVCTDVADYKSENPKIIRCERTVNGIKESLNKAFMMPYDNSGREYVVAKHNKNVSINTYVQEVYNVDWEKNYQSGIKDALSTLYDLNFSGPHEDNNYHLTLNVYKTPSELMEIGKQLTIDYIVYYQNGNLLWNDELKLSVEHYGVWSNWSTAWISLDDVINYEIKINGIVVETGVRNEKGTQIARNFVVNDLMFLYEESPIYYEEEEEKDIISAEMEVDDNVDISIISKEWELMVDSVLETGVPLELYSWPLVSKSFCEKIISDAEARGNWTSGRHDYYPTHDILLKDIGYEDLYNNILDEYAHPAVRWIWSLNGSKWENMEVESFIVKYDNSSIDAQNYLALHHDYADYTFVVGLNDAYSGGGTWFPRQKYLIDTVPGVVTVHPTITHKHGARPVTEGIRYVLISFCRQS